MYSTIETSRLKSIHDTSVRGTRTSNRRLSSCAVHYFNNQRIFGSHPNHSIEYEQPCWDSLLHTCSTEREREREMYGYRRWPFLFWLHGSADAAQNYSMVVLVGVDSISIDR